MEGSKERRLGRLEGRVGHTPYEYEVSEVFVAELGADWVVEPVRDRDMVTSQTWTMPIFENRLIVRVVCPI